MQSMLTDAATEIGSIEASDLCDKSYALFNDALVQFDTALQAAYDKLCNRIADDENVQAVLPPYLLDRLRNFAVDVAEKHDLA